MSDSCSRPACHQRAAATLTYDYGARAATLQPLGSPHPMHYDLCAHHADTVTVPNGWTLVDHRSPCVQDVVRPTADVAPRLAS